MFMNNRKTNISKYFLFMVLVICMIAMSLNCSIENTYAADIDQNSTCGENIIKIEDKLGNSHIDDEILKQIDSKNTSDLNVICADLNSSNSGIDEKLGISNDNEILGKTYTLKDGTFGDIQDAIKKASAGDTIKLSGTFKPDSDDSKIKVTKRLTITSDSVATLNGLQKMNIMRLYEDAQGTVIKNIKFINSNGTRGGALRVSTKNVLVENCVFQNNHATVAGALSSDNNFTSSENLIVRGCNFTGNSAFTDALDKETGSGALSALSRGSQVINCIFENNYAKSSLSCYGGAIQVGMDNANSNCKVTNCIFKNNQAISANHNSHGGAGCVRDGVSYTNCVFIGNSADQGGALTMHASGNIVNCKFINNTAKTHYGGAISSGFLFDTMVLKINNCFFEGNTAPYGGAIQAIGLNVAISNSDFIKNRATNNGGAITVQALNVSIDKVNFTSNRADVDGGAIYLNGNESVVSNSIFKSNMAIPDVNKVNDGLGGAIYVNSLKAALKNNEFTYNTARNGSAIYFESSGKNLILTNNILFENQAWVYNLPIHVEDIYYGDTEEINVVIYGGNNIANYDNLAVSNAIYNAANCKEIMVDGENPLYGATMNGQLYQDSREFNINIHMKIVHEDGEVIYENTSNSSYLGEIELNLPNLRPGNYYVTASHSEDTYYKAISNTTLFTVYPKIDNQISITTEKDEYNFEDVVVWTINITNNGPNDATGVNVTYLLPDGIIYFMDSSGGLYNPSTGIINVSTLKYGEKRSFNIVTIINKTGEFFNKAEITAVELDTDLSNNQDNVTIKVNPATDLAISKSVNNSNPNYMDIVNWTIVVRNNGPDIAHNITVIDLIPSNLILINYTGDYDSKKGMWKFETLGAGEEITLNLITKIASTGIIENSAKVNASEYDYDLSNNHDEERIMVDPSADLSIIKTVNVSNVNFWDTVKWTLTITNNGPDIASDVRIRDILPEGFTYLNSSLEYEDDEIYIGNLSVGQTISVDIFCLVEITGNYTNFAEVKGNEYDYNMENNHDNESITINPAADLEIEKTVDDSEPEFGSHVYWTIVVRNNGPDSAHNVQVSDLFSNELIYVSDDGEGDYNPETGIWDIGTLDADEEVSLEICSIVNKTGLITNHANVTAHEYDYDMDNNQADESVEIELSADVSVIKKVNNTSPNYNDLITWTVEIFNNGPDNATNVEVIDVLPDGLLLINSTGTKGQFIDGLWTIDLLEKDEVQKLELICKVTKTGNITNIANVSIYEHDFNLTNDESNETINVPPAVDIEVILDVNKSKPYFGEEILWMIMIKNNGPDNASEVNLTDILSNSLIFIEYNATKGEYNNGIWNVGSLCVGEVEYLNITSITNETGVTINEAYAISNEYDWNMSNNYDNALIDVSPVTDLSIEKYVNNTNPNYLDVIKWSLKVVNNGPNEAVNVKVIDILPEGLEFIKSSDDSNYKDGIWYIGQIEVGGVRQLDIVSKVISTGVIKNTANVSGDNFDPNLDNNEDEEIISINPASDLSVTKITSKKHYIVGDLVKYTITVVNNGPDTAYNVKVSDILDKSLVLKSFKVSKGNFDKTTKIWKIDSLESGESAVLILNVVAIGDGIIKNTVVVTSDSYDYNMTNNNDSCFINVSKKPEIENVSIPHKKEFKVQKTILHEAGNPILMLLFSVMSLSGISFRKII